MHSDMPKSLGDHDPQRALEALLRKERGRTADLLAHLSEFDARRLYVQEGFSSMVDYCVERLHVDEDEVEKRILAARTGRKFPVLFEAIAEGELHIEAVVLLAPYLTRENADELIAAASRKPESEIERMLSERFPRR